jgi:Zn-dependent protease
VGLSREAKAYPIDVDTVLDDLIRSEGGFDLSRYTRDVQGVEFRLLGTPVRIEWTFALIAVVGGLGRGNGAFLATWVGAVFVSILVHELGHALTFRAFGHRARIVLYAFGGLTYGEGRALSPARNIVVSASGSTAGILLVGLPSYFLARTDVLSSSVWHQLFSDLAWVSLGWGLVNLLPLLPLDGGNIAATILTRLAGGRGMRLTRLVSVVTAGAAAGWAFVAHVPFLGLYALVFAGINLQGLRDEREAPLNGRILQGYRSLEDQDLHEAMRSADAVLATARSAGTRARALELRAWALLQANRLSEANRAVEQMAQGTEPTQYLQGCLSLAAGDREEGTRVVAQALLRDPRRESGATVAACLARARVVSDLVGTLLSMKVPDGPVAAHSLSNSLHAAGLFQEASVVNERLFLDGRVDRGVAAYNRACNLARMGAPEEAVTWLRRAVGSGFSDTNLLDQDPDLDPLRAMEGFRELRSEMVRSEDLGLPRSNPH